MFAGVGDSLLLGFGDDIRDYLGISGGVDKCSDSYGKGEIAALLAGGARLAYAGLAKVGSIVASSGAKASSFRQGLKVVFRGGFGKSFRKPNLKGKSDSALRRSAGKTNKAINAYGAGVAASTIDTDCECS